jgi:hypothetical protein
MGQMKAKKTGRRWPSGNDLYDEFEIARNTASAFRGTAVISEAHFHEKRVLFRISWLSLLNTYSHSGVVGHLKVTTNNSVLLYSRNLYFITEESQLYSNID